jgi:hypothetical protein
MEGRRRRIIENHKEIKKEDNLIISSKPSASLPLKIRDS